VNVKNEPVITNLSPSYGISNQLASIIGKGFSNDKNVIKVFLGETECLVLDVQDTLINFKVPEKQVGAYDVYVLKSEKKIISPEKFIVIEQDKPAILKVTPNEGSAGFEFEIHGINFGNNDKNITVDFFRHNYTYKANFSLESTTIIKAYVPQIYTGYYSIKVKIGKEELIAPEQFNVYDFDIVNGNIYPIKVYPDSVQRGDTINIVTKNYGVPQNKITFLIGGNEYQCLSFSDTLVRMVVPDNVSLGYKNVGFRYYYNGALVTRNSPNQVFVYNPFQSFSKIEFWIANVKVKRHNKSSFSQYPNGSSSSEKIDTIIKTFYFIFGENEFKREILTDKSSLDTINISSYQYPSSSSIYCSFDRNNKKIIKFSGTYNIPLQYNDAIKTFVTCKQVGNNLAYSLNEKNEIISFIGSNDLSSIQYGIDYKYESNYYYGHTMSSTTETQQIIAKTDSSFIRVLLTPK
jgi:hypothetical protein